jgi:hypothetical protein
MTLPVVMVPRPVILAVSAVRERERERERERFIGNYPLRGV